MKLLALFVLTTLAQASTPSGDEILARAGAADNLTSFSVPVHFNVHMKRPVGIRAQVEGIVYYRAPESAALVLTKVPGPLSGFFKGSYRLALTPQVWPPQYSITTVTPGTADTSATFVLEGTPRVSDPSIDHVEVAVAQADYSPMRIVWFYRDKSEIRLTMQTQRLSGAALPRTETIDVNMPQYALDATATYGDYALNAPIPEGIFPHQ